MKAIFSRTVGTRGNKYLGEAWEGILFYKFYLSVSGLFKFSYLFCKCLASSIVPTLLYDYELIDPNHRLNSKIVFINNTRYFDFFKKITKTKNNYWYLNTY